MLDICGLNKTFHRGTVNERQAIRSLDLSIEEGDFITVIGGNGAGKSTLLNLISGVFPPDSGSISLEGRELSHLPEYQRACWLGRVFQDPMMGTAGNMEIEENLAMAARRGKKRGLAWAIRDEERRQYRDRLASLGLGLEHRMHDKVGLLSGGQRQALTLLMATQQRPKLLLLDEHTAALDPKTAAIILQVTESLIREQGLTALMVTHNMRDAIHYGNRLIMMEHGRVRYDVCGEEKKRLKVEDLINLFRGEDSELSDRMLLS